MTPDRCVCPRCSEGLAVARRADGLIKHPGKEKPDDDGEEGEAHVS
jgi:hypothetical protein